MTPQRDPLQAFRSSLLSTLEPPPEVGPVVKLQREPSLPSSVILQILHLEVFISVLERIGQ